jgi:hypothetical protein
MQSPMQPIRRAKATFLTGQATFRDNRLELRRVSLSQGRRWIALKASEKQSLFETESGRAKTRCRAERHRLESRVGFPLE